MKDEGTVNVKRSRFKKCFLVKTSRSSQRVLGMNFRPVERLNFNTLPKQILYQLVNVSCST